MLILSPMVSLLAPLSEELACSPYVCAGFPLDLPVSDQGLFPPLMHRADEIIDVFSFCLSS